MTLLKGNCNKLAHHNCSCFLLRFNWCATPHTCIKH